MRLQDGNPMTMPIAVTLLFQVIVFGLAIPGMIMVDDVAVGLAFASGLGAAALALAAGATLRRPVGWPLAWLTQLAGIALGGTYVARSGARPAVRTGMASIVCGTATSNRL